MTVHTSEPVDGFTLTYEIRAAAAPPEPGSHRAAVLLHGWPGDRTDYRATLPLLDPAITVVVPDLRGVRRLRPPPGRPDSRLLRDRAGT